MRAPAYVPLFFAMVLVWGPAAGASESADPVAAERQYRVAQRLGADRSPDAAAAFQKAIALAPNGPLADDALVELARLSGAPDWPEDVATLDAARAEAAAVPLESVLASHPDGDRADEARYRRALIRLAPIPGRDAARARQDLLALAAVPSRDRFVVAARYALGVLDEQAGAEERAGGAFARIVVERPDSDVAPRARAGFGRTLLAQGQFGIAAGWFQDAIATGVAEGVRADALRELALREVLRERGPGRRWAEIASPLPAIATTKGAAALATLADGRLLVLNRKSGTLQTFDAQGVGSAPLPLAGITALATDPYGRVFLATKDKIFRFEATGVSEILSLARGTAPAAIAVDASGAVWIADRRGDRVERWIPGSTTPVVVRESKGAGVAALAIAGGRVLAAESKTGQLVILAGPEFDAGVATVTFRRPVALAVDAAGRISVLDEKAGTVTRLTSSGAVCDTLPLAIAGVSRPVAIASTPDGALQILDESTGAIAVAR